MSFISPENYELGLITKDITDKKTYYANNDGNVIKIYKDAPANMLAAQVKSLYDLVTDAITGYEMGTDPTPEDAVPFYVISEDIGEEYKINDNPPMYVLPSLSIEKFDNKVEAEKQRLAAEAAAVEAERLRLEKIESDRLAAVEAERLRLEKEQADEAERLRLEKEQADEAERLQLEKIELDRITEMLKNYKADTSKRKGLPNSIIIGDVTQTSACYINAMLQMLIDIDEFLNYILFMNELIKESEHATLVEQEVSSKAFFDDCVKNVAEVGDANIQELLILIYKVVTDNDINDVSDFTNLDENNLNAALVLLKFTTNLKKEVLTSVDVKDKKGIKTKKKMSEDQIDIYKKYYEILEIDYKTEVVHVLDLTNVNNSLQLLFDIKTKLEVFKKKHNTITLLKKIFEYVIDGIETTQTKTTNVIKDVNDVQTTIGYTGVEVGHQEDATAVYSLINVVFDEELFKKYGLNVKHKMYDSTDGSTHFISPVNLPDNNNNTLSSIIKDNVSMNPENVNSQKYIVFANSQSSNIFDSITIDGKHFKPIGIVKHVGEASNSTGSYGGHYIYHSLKTLKTFDDLKVHKLDENEQQTTFTRCVALYERYDDSSARAGGSRKTFRVSRRKKVRPL